MDNVEEKGRWGIKPSEVEKAKRVVEDTKRKERLSEGLIEGNGNVIKRLGELYNIIKLVKILDGYYVKLPDDWVASNTYETQRHNKLVVFDVKENHVEVSGTNFNDLVDMLQGFENDFNINSSGEISCPHCGEYRIRKLGTITTVSRGERQRFICMSCGKSFYEDE